MTEPDEPSVPPQFLADETLFRCEVRTPDPDAVSTRRRTQGTVAAYPVGSEAAPLAGTLSYFTDGDRLETISFCVQPEARGMGCATEMVKALRRTYPGFTLSSSPARPTQLGRDTLVALHKRGLVDELRIDLEGEVCEPETGRCDGR